MPLFGFGGKNKDPNELLAHKDYEGAIKGFRAILEESPDDMNSRLRLADALSCVGRTEEAIEEYLVVAEDYAERGFLVKAIAVNKKIVKLDSSRDDIHKKLVELDKMYRGEAVESEDETEDVASVAEESVPEEVEDDSGSEDEERDLKVKTPLFSDFEPDEFNMIVKGLNYHVCPEDTVIVTEGDEGDSMFVIVRGEVSVITHDQENKPFELTRLGEGDFFGEVSLLTGKPRTATIKTTMETEFLELMRDELDSIANSHPEIWKIINSFYESRVSNTIESMIERLRASRE